MRKQINVSLICEPYVRLILEHTFEQLSYESLVSCKFHIQSDRCLTLEYRAPEAQVLPLWQWQPHGQPWIRRAISV
jgi:hypothetical protein